jgi:hypothetical protein
MALKVKCEKCGEDLIKPGALVFSPPEGNVCLKFHICEKCWPAVALLVQGIAGTGMVATSKSPVLRPNRLKT